MPFETKIRACVPMTHESTIIFLQDFCLLKKLFISKPVEYLW